jgi:ferric enterobactin receptor
MNPKLLLAFSIFITQISFAQKPNYGRLYGKIIDAGSKETLPFATLSVFKKSSPKDSLIASISTKENGEFSFGSLPVGSLSLSISFVGYQTVNQPVELLEKELDLGTIQIFLDAKLLKEVEVNAEKDQIAFGMDKRVFNVGKNLTTIGGTAEAVLRNVPTISIDETGNASIRNLATTIYINGKPTQLSLSQIPANQIESVEVISNPSARYDASTSGGIVNLVLKKNKDAGFNGSASVGIGNNSRYDAALNLDYHKSKWNFTGLYNLNSTQNSLDGFVHRTNLRDGSETSYFNQNTILNLNNAFQNGRLVVDFAANKKNTFSIASTIVGGAFNTVSEQKYDYKNAERAITSYGGRFTKPKNAFTNLSLEFDWKKQFNQKGGELNLLSSYTRNRVSNAADWLTTAIMIDGKNLKGFPETDKISGRQIGSQYLAQLDYVQPINDSSKFEIGLRSYTFGRDQQYFFKQENNETKVFDLLQNYSQDAFVKETINAVYFIYGRRLKKGINMDLGLRFEQSYLHGLSRFDNARFGYDYPSASGSSNWLGALFPSFSLSKKTGKESEINFNLSRKVGRPNFRHLFVGIQANDRQNITIGNPKVQPEFVNTAELNYNRNIGRASWFASAYYILEDNTIKPFVQPSATDPTILVTTFVNVKNEMQYGLENTLKYSLGGFSTNANLNIYVFSIAATNIQKQNLTYKSKLNFSYRFPANILTQLNLIAEGASPALQGNRLPLKAADFAIRKSFLKNQGNVIFSINDVFNSRKYITTYEQANIYQETMNRREVRFYKLTLQLPLGKPNASFKKKERKLEKPDVDFSN